MSRILDDAELLQRAVQSPQPLWRCPERIERFTPLIFVAACLPALMALPEWHPDDLAAIWRLRALSLSVEDSWQGTLVPGRMFVTPEAYSQPPGVCWLQGWLIHRLPEARDVIPVLVSAISTVMVVLLLARLAQVICGARVVLWCVLIASLDSRLVGIARSAGPEALGMVCVMATTLELLKHLNDRAAGNIWSWSMFWASFAWGLGLLIAGPMMLPVPLLALTASLFPVSENIERVPYTRRRAISAAAVLLVLGLLLAGWQVLPTLAGSGGRSPLAWMTSRMRPWDEGTPATSLWTRWGHIGGARAPLVIWIVVGWRELCLRWWRARHDVERQRLQWILAWWLMAFALRMACEIWTDRSQQTTRLWEAFLLVPELLLVSLGIDAAIHRSATGLWLSLGIALAIGGAVAGISHRFVIGISVVVLSFVICSMTPYARQALRRSSRGGWRESDKRLILQTLLLITFAEQLTWSTWGIAQYRQRQDRLPTFVSQLAGQQMIDRTIVLAPGLALPPTLEYVLRSTAPRAGFVVRNKWDPALLESLPPTDPRPQQCLLVEWSHRDSRTQLESNTGWALEPVTDAIRFRGFRLVAYRMKSTTN